MLKADFEAVRGKFKFGSNQHPVQDWVATKVEKGPDGTAVIKTVGKVFTDKGDVFSKDCKL
jgi:branched-chain amino acid transport system substrate-binding protein